MSGAKVKRIRYSPDFSLPVREVLDELEEGARILGLANPNGALGTYTPMDALGEVLTVAQAHGTLVILDEAYVDYAQDELLSRLADFSNVVLVRTFSKAAGLAGLRVGYGVGSATVIGWLRQVRPNVEINQVGVAACRYLLARPSIVAEHVDRTISGRDILAQELRKLGLEVRIGHANFLHVRLAYHHDAVHLALKEASILVKDHPDDSILNGWTRITAADPDHMTVVADVIRSVVDGE